ncbi:Genetic interactor of prohibitins 3, mitochondrial, partial [Pseudocercospora fuligena]
ELSFVSFSHIPTSIHRLLMLRLARLTRHTHRLISARTETSTASAGLTSLLTRQPRWPAADPNRHLPKSFSRTAWRPQEEAVEAKHPRRSTQIPSAPSDEHLDFAKTLPVVCPGCGALSQTIEDESPGFYSPRRRNTRRPKRDDEERIFQEAIARLADSDTADTATLTTAATTEVLPQSTKPMLCDRCHDLIYQSKGTSILHPSMESIRDIIEASPHRDNHIYHVLDAADFPMSLIPNLIARLDLPRLRTQNRRSKATQYIRGRQADISFIITRSDLLAPQKEMVDRLMPYLQEVLRDALGRAGKNLRLGNVRCVSAKRGWWTPQVKEEIWKRGGAGWVVGKVNVGKSALFDVVYPKGRNLSAQDQEKLRKVRQRGQIHVDSLDKISEEDIHAANDALEQGGQLHLSNKASVSGIGDSMMEATEAALEQKQDHDQLSPFVPSEVDDSAQQTLQRLEVEEQLEDEVDADEEEGMSLLPPAQKEVQYPDMPIVSSLPGTTAAPIRIPFGNGKGELIDLPGVMRSSMETHVKPEHHASLVMKSRIVPEQYTLKPGQSLLLGGIVRITPKSEDFTVLAYPFTPLHAHATATRKAIAIQTGVGEEGEPYVGTVENIATDKAKQRIKSAGTFKLEWDATKKRTGSLTDKTAGKRKVADLPFIVYSADIIIEGVGWVELACQVRSRKKSLISDAFTAELGHQADIANDVPEIEIFTPKGKFIGIRKPMNAWITGGPRKVAKHAQRKRPRMSISYHKRVQGGKAGSQKANLVLV